MLINIQKRDIKLKECKPTFMISKKGKTTNVQFAAFKGGMVSKKDFLRSNPGELTYQGHKKRLSIPKNSSAFLATGRGAKTASVRGGFGTNSSEGVEVGRYTPRYPQTKKTPSYSFQKRGRQTSLFLFAPYTWMRDAQKPAVSYFFRFSLKTLL